jgi:hypothetical protein
MNRHGCAPVVLAGWILIIGFVYTAWAIFQWVKP